MREILSWIRSNIHRGTVCFEVEDGIKTQVKLLGTFTFNAFLRMLSSTCRDALRKYVYVYMKHEDFDHWICRWENVALLSRTQCKLQLMKRTEIAIYLSRGSARYFQISLSKFRLMFHTTGMYCNK